MKNKIFSLSTIILSIFNMLILAFISSKCFDMTNYLFKFNQNLSYSSMYILITFFLLLYINYKLNKNNLVNKNELEKVAIFTNISMIIIYVIDIIYNGYFSLYAGSITNNSIFIYKIIFTLLIVWTLLLVEKPKSDNIKSLKKIILYVFTILLFLMLSFIFMCFKSYSYIPLVFCISILIKNFMIKYNKFLYLCEIVLGLLYLLFFLSLIFPSQTLWSIFITCYLIVFIAYLLLFLIVVSISKKISTICFIISSIIFLFFFASMKGNIYKVTAKSFGFDFYKIVFNETNEYSRTFSNSIVKLTDDFVAKDKKHLINIYYTFLNSGKKETKIYCSDTYKKCLSDVRELSKDQNMLTYLSTLINPYNKFSGFDTTDNSNSNSNDNELFDFIIENNKAYTNEQIKEINDKIKEIDETVIKDITDKKEIVKLLHDYIINNSKYDTDRRDKNIINYKSNIAYGPLIEGYGISGGYTDAMSLFLDYYNIPNFQVISDNHIWNAVYLDGEWYHLDLAWDDPVTSNGEQLLIYDYYLITTEKLNSINDGDHAFDTNLYRELVK